MSVRSEPWVCQGEAGPIECLVDHPEGAPTGWALVLHPHPLYGGTRNNKVVTTVARVCQQHGLMVVRPNFRGVGASAGTFDRAVGETADMVRCVAQVLMTWPDLAAQPWVLAGFSFGSAVAAQLYAELATQGAGLPARLMLLGCAVERFRYRTVEVPADTLLIHGEHDTVVPLTEGMDFARAHDLAVTVVPDSSHFFDGKLLVLRAIVQRTLTGVPAS